MTIEQLDFIFPFVVFFYGALMTFTLNHPALCRLADKKLPYAVVQQMRAHRNLGIICLFVGSFWSLQNIWLR